MRVWIKVSRHLIHESRFMTSIHEGRRRPQHSPAYASAENEARRGHLGLWSDREAVPPWEWRNEIRKTREN